MNRTRRTQTQANIIKIRDRPSRSAPQRTTRHSVNIVAKRNKLKTSAFYTHSHVNRPSVKTIGQQSVNL